MNEFELQICTMETKSLDAVASQLQYLVQIKQVQLPLHLPCTLETRQTKAKRLGSLPCMSGLEEILLIEIYSWGQWETPSQI